MNVAWHSVDFEEASESAALLLVKLFPDTLHYVSAPLILLKSRLCADYEAVLAQSLLGDVTHDVGLVGAEDILHVKREDVARHSAECHIDIYINEIVSVASVDDELSLRASVHIVLDLKDSEASKKDCAQNRHYVEEMNHI